MAKRVRKLARELMRTPEEVLSILADIGFSKYRSPEDMLPDHVMDRVRKANRELGHRGLPSAPLSTPRLQALGPERAGGRDVMARLMGDSRGRTPSQAPQAPQASLTEMVLDASAATQQLRQQLDRKQAMIRELQAVVEQTKKASSGRDSQVGELQERLEQVEAEWLLTREELKRTRTELAQARTQAADLATQVEELQASLGAVQAEHQACQVELAAVQAARDELDSHLAQAPVVSGRRLTDLLQERGLRGVDEFERAILQLAAGRMLRDLLGYLCVVDEGMVRNYLDNRLILVASEPPEELSKSMASIVVAPSRAELPEKAVVDREIGKLSEVLMLNGLRRVLIVGGRPILQRLVQQGMDERLDVRFSAPIPRDRAMAQSDVTRTDAVILWGVDVLPEAEEVYQGCRAVVLRIASAQLNGLGRGALLALNEDDD